jgi:hypothetical protein
LKVSLPHLTLTESRIFKNGKQKPSKFPKFKRNSFGPKQENVRKTKSFCESDDATGNLRNFRQRGHVERFEQSMNEFSFAVSSCLRVCVSFTA